MKSLILNQTLILLSQKVQNTSLPIIYTNYTKFHMHQLQTIYIVIASIMGGQFENLGAFQELDGNNKNPFIPHLPKVIINYGSILCNLC